MARSCSNHYKIQKFIGRCLLAALILCLCMCGSGGSSSSPLKRATRRRSGAQTGSSAGSSIPLPGLADGFIRKLCRRPNRRRTSTTSAGFPSSDHVFVIMLENQDFTQVFPSGSAANCSSSGMPYLCSLAAANGMATHFYANAHGSLLSYLFNTSGANWKGKPWTARATPVPPRA